MGIAERQDLPNRPTEKSEWSFRHLLGGSTTAISTAFTKVFVSPFEWLLTFSMVVIAFGEIWGANLSSFFYWTAAILLVCVILRRVFNTMDELRAEESRLSIDHSKKK